MKKSSAPSKLMESTIPNPCKSKPNIIHIGGIPVEFPYQPYGTQLAYMNRVISTLDKAKREDHSHALLESPTGTGKSLSLLCSALAWQQNYKKKVLFSNLSTSKPNPEAKTDPLGHGGGFIPETQPSEPGPLAEIEGIINKKKKLVPVIYYSSRTHGQISQVIREYKKTSYRVPMAILGSRKHYCTNKNIRGRDDIDEQCKLLLKNQAQVGCMEFKNVLKVKSHPSLQKGGCHEVHDIEDLVKVGQAVKGCSYFASQKMAEDAQIIFCPYNYIINPIIRRAMDVDLHGSIVIFDEAHNIEDIARDAGSINVEEDVLSRIQTELEQLSMSDPMTYEPLAEMIQDIISWIGRRIDNLEKREFQHYFTCWSGEKALKELQEANITPQCYPILQECAAKAFKAVAEAQPNVPHLSGMAAIVLEGLFSSLSYLFLNGGIHVSDFELSLQKLVKRDGGSPVTGGYTHTFSLRCLNPSVVFKQVSDVSLSVILTSGTLSPMTSFSSELGVNFGTSLEAPHIIDVDSQLWTGVISNGPGNYPLNASYKTANALEFQDSLGKSLEEIFKVVPGGCLIFFPSYKLMDKLCNRWKETNQWSLLKAQKSIFVEPRGGTQENAFEPVLKSYYSTIDNGDKSVISKKRRGKKMDLDIKPIITKKGAAFFAVCRGKVSEGLDFADDYARVVIIVGIPFPNVYDIQVAQKKKFNDIYKSSKNLLSGNEWYCLQAFRALNQASGRCIRHKLDYGAIIYLDERFCEERNRASLSKWFRKSIKQYDNLQDPLEGLKSFFRDVKDRIVTLNESVQSCDMNVEVISSIDHYKEIAEKKNQKEISKSSQFKPFSSYVTKQSSPIITQMRSNIQSFTPISIDLDGDSDTESRSCVHSLTDQSLDDPDLTMVKETPIVPSMDFTYDLLSFEQSSPDPKSTSIIHTPEKPFTLKIKKESPLTLSVNSHVYKKRKSLMDHQITENTISFNNRFESINEINEKSDFKTDKKLQLCCLVCKKPLGLPKNDSLITCLYTSLSKVYLRSLCKDTPEVPMVIISDVSSVNQRLLHESGSKEGIWCKEDGCVFNIILCPFCIEPKTCLGVHVMATDSLNTHLQDKILFYSDRLEIKSPQVVKNKIENCSTSSDLKIGEKSVISIEKFAYIPQDDNLGGWRTTKSKMRLPKRSINSTK